MSELDNLVNQMAEELNSPNEYSLSTSPESNPSYILINPDRTLTVPDNLKKIGIQHDHNVESVVFKCPRYNDGIDLSTMTVITIQWMKSNNKGGKSICTLDPVGSDDTYFTFTWNITEDVTSERGLLNIMVCMTKTNESGTEALLHWNSEINDELYVGEGLHISDEEIFNNYQPGLVGEVMARIADTEDTLRSYSIDIKEIPSGYAVTMTDNEGSETFNIFHGYASDKGATFTPTISDDGVLSWTNDKGLDNPPDINIKGPKGDRGETVYVPSVSEEGVLSWTNDGGLENPAEVNIRGPQGETGPAGPQGETGVGERGPMGATYEDKELIDGAADLDPLQKYRVYIPMNRKSITESGIDLLPNSIFGDYPYYPYISHAVTINNDIYYIVQCANYSAWPKLMMYRAETNEVEELITIPNYLFDPINSHMVVTDDKYITIWGLWSAMMNAANPPNIILDGLLWYGGKCISWDISKAPVSTYYVEDTLVTEHISTPGMVKIDKSVSNVPHPGYPEPEQYYTYIFGGYDKATQKYNTKVYAMWTASDGTTVHTFLVEIKDKDGNSIALDEDSYITTTVVLNNKVYLFGPSTGRMTVFDLETHAIDKKFATGLGSDAPYNFDESTRIYSIISTVVVNDKIYFLVDNDGKYNNCAVFDPVTEQCSAVDKNDILGTVPSSRLDLSGDPMYNPGVESDYDVDPIHNGQRGVLPTVYLNDKPYIIKRMGNPVYLELPEDMYQEYIWLTSEEFGTERVDFLDNVDFYDDVRNYFEVEICGLKPNDICTTAEIEYTYNNQPYTKPIDLPWVSGVTKDISSIKLHVEHATKVLRYNTNTEYGELTPTAAMEADIEQLKADVANLGAGGGSKEIVYVDIKKMVEENDVELYGSLINRLANEGISVVGSLTNILGEDENFPTAFELDTLVFDRYYGFTQEGKEWIYLGATVGHLHMNADLRFSDVPDLYSIFVVWDGNTHQLSIKSFNYLEMIGLALGSLPQDIQIDGSTIVENGVANIPIATAATVGLAKFGGGLFVAEGGIVTPTAIQNNTVFFNKEGHHNKVGAPNIEYIVKAGLIPKSRYTDTEYSALLTLNNDWTPEEQAAARETLGITGGGGTQLYKHRFFFGVYDDGYSTYINDLTMLATTNVPFTSAREAIQHAFDNGLENALTIQGGQQYPDYHTGTEYRRSGYIFTNFGRMEYQDSSTGETFDEKLFAMQMNPYDGSANIQRVVCRFEMSDGSSALDSEVSNYDIIAL